MPDDISWILSVDIQQSFDFSEDDPDPCPTIYCIKLVVAKDLEETILTSEEFWGDMPDGIDEKAEILNLFNDIVANAASDFAYTVRNGGDVLCISKTIEECTENWKYQFETRKTHK